MENKPLATTFNDGETIEVIILSKPSSTGLCKLDYNGRTIVRHINRIYPINQEAIDFLK